MYAQNLRPGNAPTKYWQKPMVNFLFSLISSGTLQVMRKKIFFASTALVLASCEALVDGPKKEKNNIVASGVLGVMGASNGHSIGGTAGAAGLGLLGLGVGFLASDKLKKSDMAAIDLALEKVLAGSIGQAVEWKNPHTGNSGTLIAMSSILSFQDEKCRWVRSKGQTAMSQNNRVYPQNEETEIHVFDDLILCDKGAGWYISWDSEIAPMLKANISENNKPKNGRR